MTIHVIGREVMDMTKRRTYKPLPKWWQFWKPRGKGKHSA